MADLSINNESKNNLNISNESKPSTGTWDDFDVAWEDVTSPWSNPGLPITKESKNNLNISNENKP